MMLRHPSDAASASMPTSRYVTCTTSSRHHSTGPRRNCINLILKTIPTPSSTTSTCFDLIEAPSQGPLDDRKAELGRIVYPGQRFIYLYDFGDSWTHTVHVENISEAPEKLGYATVIDGAGACPPEDAGGPPGYIEFLDTIERGPQSQEAREMLDWAGGDFDANLFDKRAANAALLRTAANGWGKK
jgi:hypothetical protein